MVLNSAVNNILMIANSEEKNNKKLFDFISKSGCKLTIEPNFMDCLTLIQNCCFNIIILDTEIKEIPIEKAIRLIKNHYPKTKIIVKTSCNSKTLEARIRQEGIYYYHIDCFGIADLELAIKSAIEEFKT